MTVSLEPISGPLVPTAWHFAEPWVRSAVDEYALIETAETYKARCIAEDAQLWLIIEDNVPAGCIVTHVYETARGLTCGIPIAAGCFQTQGENVLETIERWARAEGCVRLEESGRLGWIKALKPHGWHPIAVVMEKEI